MAAFVQPPGEMLNGLSSPYGSFKVFAPQRLKKAEEITAEIIACIQPNQTSENRRTAIYNYLRLLIANCFSCKVCTIGSVPFKTYLPDGDMKLTIFSDIQNLTDTWAYAVGEKLIKSKNNNVDAKFDAKDVEYIKSGSKVHIVKCVVDNIEVEISYNQLGDLGTLCFFEEVDHLISQNHLFKRSIILIKAWCYYEARHKLISTHALETLVIYIFNVYNDSFVGPLEVLYRFLELFSNFDWDNYCVSLQGPVPISSLPDVAAEPPRKDSEELLMSRVFLQSCISVYGVHPHCQENEMQPFSKHFNIIDPLCTSNNLGHSVNEGDFVRIRNAFADGANKLGTLLDSSEESFLLNLNLFFSNTRIRHCSSLGPNIKISRNRHDSPVVTKYVYTKETNFDPKDLIFGFKGRESNFTGRHGSGLRPDSPISEILKKDYSNKIEKNLKKNLGSNQPSQRDSESNNISINNNNLLNDIQGRFPFARTRSSPELTDTYSYNHNNRKKNSPTRSGRSSNEDLPSVRSTGGGLNNNYHRDEEQEEQDLVNVMASSSSFQGGLNGQFHIPMNFPVGYAHQRNFPANIPLIDPSFSNIQFPNGLVSQPLTHYFSNVGIRANSEESTSTVNENFEQSTDNEFFDSENGDLDRSSLAGLKYIPPSRATGSTKSQPKYSKRVEIQSLSSSESFSGKTTEDKRGKKIVPAESSSSVYNKSKTISDDDSEMTEIPSTRSTGVLPFTFYATGPPVPFVTMLPLYTVPPGSSTEEGLDNTAETRQKFDSSEVADERMSDILHSDFLCHWKNLQYGRFCQNVQPQGPMVYPTAPVMVPPNYLQGRIAWDGPGRPVGSNSNLVSQLMSYGPRIVPVAAPPPMQTVSNRPPNVYQRYVEELPRYRSGTGTYLPNPKVTGRDQHSSNNRRANYNYNYNYDERETNTWNPRNSKTRAGGRNNHHNRNPNDKSSTRLAATAGENRSWNSYRPTTLVNSGQPNAAYGMYPAPAAMNNPPSGSNGPNVQSLVMVYPYENNSAATAGASYGLHPHTPDQLEFGSVGGRAGLSNEQLQVNEGGNRLRGVPFEDHRFHGASPDQPSSPRHPRRG